MATVNLVSVILVVLNSRLLSSQIPPKLIVTVTTGYADIEGGTLTVTTGSGSGRYENGSFTTSMSEIGDKGQGHILDSELMAQWEKKQMALTFIYFPLLGLGIVGNILSCVLLARKAVTSSMANYLCVLCVVDAIYLMTSSTAWLYRAFTGVDIRKYTNCNVYFIFHYLPKFTSAWLLVAISTERVMAIYYPLVAKSVCSPQLSRKVPLAIVLCMCFFIWPGFGGFVYSKSRSPEEDSCVPRQAWIKTYMDQYNGWLAMFLYPIIPSVILILSNAATFVKFAKVRRAKRRVHATGTGTGSDSADVEATTNVNLTKNSKRITIIAVVLSMTFVCLTLPQNLFYTYFIHNVVELSRDPASLYHHHFIYQLLETLQLLNHAINFALYCLTSANFKRDLIGLFKCQGIKGGGLFSSISD